VIVMIVAGVVLWKGPAPDFSISSSVKPPAGMAPV
jgi:hypothetical protein